EDWARYFSIALGVTSLLALWLLWRHRRDRLVPRAGVTLVLVLGVVSSALGAWAGLLGGQVHHEEARPGFVPPPRPPRPAGAAHRRIRLALAAARTHARGGRQARAALRAGRHRGHAARRAIAAAGARARLPRRRRLRRGTPVSGRHRRRAARDHARRRQR